MFITMKRKKGHDCSKVWWSRKFIIYMWKCIARVKRHLREPRVIMTLSPVEEGECNREEEARHRNKEAKEGK